MTWKTLIESSRIIPSFTINQVEEYFIHRNDSDGLERQDWKNFNDKGFKLFKEGHVQSIRVGMSDDMCCVKAKCLPEMKKDLVYDLKLFLYTTDGAIKVAECKCPAGKGPTGSCKHIAALCYALEDFNKTRHSEDGEVSCTSLLQQWSMPSRKRRLDSKMVSDINFRTEKREYDYKRHPADIVDPRPAPLQRTTKADLEEFADSLQSLPLCGFTHLLSKEEEANTSDSDALPLLPRSIQFRIRQEILELPLPPSLECIDEFGRKFVSGISLSDVQRRLIEKKTRLQANCVRWHEERYCRLTSSNFGRIVKRKSGFENLALELLRPQKLLNVPALKWGREHESDAYECYNKKLSHRHPELTLKKSGLIIGETPYLGASPDGILTNESGNIVGLLEIKCPFSAAKLTVSEACEQLDKFYIHKNDDGCSLDSSHTYYYQVQGSMAISNVKFTDFVVWTPSSLEIINVKYYPAIWTEEMLPRLKTFYTLYMLPAILY